MSEVSHNEWMEMVKNVNRGMVNTRMAKAIIGCTRERVRKIRWD
ncbi:hypothetical protein NRS6167_10345 [Bacillus subtilis]|nr:hypothetical protein NRS6167_00465 [Bacillus subtilis]CAI6268595.1 hypothetical protein NRS6167_10345 [Bacillus subtilis]